MATAKTLKICIVVPAYNEARVIRRVVRAVPRTTLISGQRVRLQVVVVDDGSSDNTAAIVRKIPGVVLLQHIVNMGAGAATRTGLHYARLHKYNLAATMDADGQHDVDDLMALLENMLDKPDIDLMIGSRLADSAGMPGHKRIGNHLLNYCTFLILGTYVSDSQSGLRGLSGRALQRLEFNSNGYAFCSEMIWQAKRADLQIGEYPIHAIYTEYSKGKGQKSYSGGLKIIQQLISRRIMELLT